MSDSSPATATDQEVLITRIFEAPRERVHIDLRVGGRYELTMVQRDGGEFAIGYDILELVEPELIVLRSDPMPEVGMHEPTITRGPRPRRGGLERRLRQARSARRRVASTGR